MTQKLEVLYLRLFEACNDMIRASQPGSLNIYEENIDGLLNRIVGVNNNLHAEISEALPRLPKIIITPEQKEFLSNLGVNIWTDGNAEVFNFNNNMTFIVKTKEDQTNTSNDRAHISYMIYPQNNAIGVYGAVKDAFINNELHCEYVGQYAVITLIKDEYSEDGTSTKLNVGDSIYIYRINLWCNIIRIDKDVPYAHQIFIVPFYEGTEIQIEAKQAFLLHPMNQSEGDERSVATSDKSE